MVQGSRPVAMIFAVALSITGAALAQEVSWRDDLSAARREASDSGRPILFDFGTETCFFCKKLDSTTFRVPAVVRLIADRFVPMKIDGEREAGLTQQFAITTFPALVVVGPDGKVLGKHEGYADAARMTRFLEQALARMPGNSTGPKTTIVPSPPLPPPNLPRAEKALPGRSGDKRA